MATLTLPLLAVLVPAAIYLTLSLQWELGGRSPVTGDEPHYLITADAIVEDHSVNVFHAYVRDREQGRIVGPIDWRNHSQGRDERWFSIHGVGLPVVLSPAFAWFGKVGARVTMALFASAVPWLLYLVARRLGLRLPQASLLTFAVSCGMPFVAAAGQIYPDLPTATLLLLLLWCLVLLEEGPLAAWQAGLACLALVALPWLHMKNALAAAALAAALVIGQSRRDRGPVRLRHGWPAAPVALSLGLLAVYNWLAFGTALGPVARIDPAGASLAQGVMIFAGLHLDQAQGVFFQQPLLLLGLLGLPMLWRRSRLVFMAVGATYLALIVPNSLHECWYGCLSLSGRFMWSVAGLWVIPLVCFLVDGPRVGRVCAAWLAGPTLAWQAYLVQRLWLEGPHPFYMNWTEDLTRRNSLIAPAWRSVFPSFYDFQTYGSFAPNAVGGVVVLLLLGGGMVLARRGRMPYRRRGPIPEDRAPCSSAGV
jgi:hypothetical protein